MLIFCCLANPTSVRRVCVCSILLLNCVWDAALCRERYLWPSLTYGAGRVVGFLRDSSRVLLVLARSKGIVPYG